MRDSNALLIVFLIILALFLFFLPQHSNGAEACKTELTLKEVQTWKKVSTNNENVRRVYPFFNQLSENLSFEARSNNRDGVPVKSALIVILVDQTGTPLQTFIIYSDQGQACPVVEVP